MEFSARGWNRTDTGGSLKGRRPWLQRCRVRPESHYSLSARRVDLVRKLHNVRGDGPCPHNFPSSLAPRTTSFAEKMVESCRLRNHHAFEGTRASPSRPRSKAWARIFTRSSTRRSTFLANPLRKPGLPRRRAPGANQREGYSR